MNPNIKILQTLTLVGILVWLPAQADFYDDIERVDQALRTNPTGALYQSLESCRKQRSYAVRLANMGMQVRAERALDYCFESLRIPREDEVVKVTAPTAEELAARADEEYEQALTLTPDVASGLQLYRECAACHEPEGWGMTSGSVPQIAGQHRNVIIRQLADFRAGNRESAMMIPYASVEAIGGTQAVADVAAYIESLEISVANGKGDGVQLALGQRVFEDKCAICHGKSAEGNNEQVIPRIQAQHYRYLQRQYEWISDGRRRNANPQMVAQIQDLNDEQIAAVLDYVSRLQPPEELQAPEGWKNPDFQ